MADAERGLWWALNPFVATRSPGQWVSDSVVFGVSLLLWHYYGFDIAGYFAALPAWYWPIDRVLGLLACLSLWWLRRYPMAIACFLILPGSIAVTGGFAVLAGIYRAASLANPRAMIPVTIAHIILALPYHWYFPLPGMSWLVWAIVIPVVYLLPLSFGLLSRSRMQVIEGLKQVAANDRERYEAELASARRGEREKIAREMHDVLAHRISLLSVHAGALEFRTLPPPADAVPRLSEAEIHQAAAIIRSNATIAVEELREVLSVLRDDAESPLQTRGRPQPRLSDVPALVQEARSAGQHVDMDFDESLTASLRDTLQRTIYRIAQEGLTNARKHAQHARVSVLIRGIDGTVEVSISNPVPLGLTETDLAVTGKGLIGLRERVRIDGGVLEHGISQGRFTLVGRLPSGAS
ncbi:sensor histidine kinase [Paenarthrobacter sp. NPDC091711]|uniref:sensor histidine kinase n=1 Tax=Paenarthrobacter sp. NPDC091711 TaxID=3364385 RepID=UPI003815FD6D